MKTLTAVVINYNGLATVCDTIRSLLESRHVDLRVIVIDDGSTDGSPAAIRRSFPQVVVHSEPRNTREVNRLRNKGLALAETERILLTDNDVTFHPDCVRELLRVMDGDEEVGVCLPRLMYLDDPQRLYQGGGRIHYLGATIAPNRDARMTIGGAGTVPEPGIGGGIGLFDAEKLRRLGGFDEHYALAWGDDGELHQRFLLAGYKSLYVPTAVGLTELKPFGKARHYRARGQLYNRWRFLLTHLSVRTLALIAPALLLYELMQAAFYLVKGMPLLYVRGNLDVLRDLPRVLRRRREIQALRRLPDGDLVFAGPVYIRPVHGVGGRVTSLAVGAAVGVFAFHWSLIQPILTASPRLRRQRREAAST